LWSSKSLTQTPTPDNPVYVGANAVREFNRIFGTTGTSVPLANTGSTASNGVHWRESVLVTEVMTPFIEAAGVAMPLSTITVGAMQDLGYTVDYAMADVYRKPGAGPISQSVNGATPASGADSLNQAAAKAFAAMADGTTVSAKPRSGYRRPAAA